MSISIDAPIVEHALATARKGLSVFPLMPGTKVPFKGTRGFKDATTDETTIRAWFDKHPTANYGVALRESDLVLDFDPRNYPEGRDVMAEMWETHLHQSPTFVVKTPAGGYHFYFRKQPSVKVATKQKAFPGVDFLSYGQYVVGPGSRIGLNGYSIEADGTDAR